MSAYQNFTHFLNGCLACYAFHSMTIMWIVLFIKCSPHTDYQSLLKRSIKADLTACGCQTVSEHTLCHPTHKILTIPMTELNIILLDACYLLVMVPVPVQIFWLYCRGVDATMENVIIINNVPSILIPELHNAQSLYCKHCSVFKSSIHTHYTVNCEGLHIMHMHFHLF